MRVLLLGTGMQGRAALDHLARSEAVEQVTAADRNLDGLQRLLAERGYGSKVAPHRCDAEDARALRRLVATGFDVVIDLLPVPYIDRVAEAAVDAGAHLVNTFYATPGLRRLADRATARGVALLPELGMDPGIDLVLLGEAVRGLAHVDEVLSYGAGIPAPEAATGPLRYKISWTFEGVLQSYHRGAVLIHDGAAVRISPQDQLAPEHVHRLETDATGPLEAFPNGDVTPYLVALGLDTRRMRRAGRFTMRYPGHAAFWHTLAQLHLLDEASVVVDGTPVDRIRYLAAAIGPHLQYGPGEQDLAILRVEVAGSCAGVPTRVRHEVIDHRDLRTGFTAMSRLVGYSASIGAQMLAGGTIERRGLLSPLTDVPFAPFLAALEAEGVQVRVSRGRV